MAKKKREDAMPRTSEKAATQAVFEIAELADKLKRACARLNGICAKFSLGKADDEISHHLQTVVGYHKTLIRDTRQILGRMQLISEHLAIR